MLKSIIEKERLVSTSREPHALATDGKTFWVSSRVTRHVDVVKRAGWRKTGELAPPGMAWGMTYAHGDVVMTCGEGADDDRWLRHYHGGQLVGKALQCPDFTGSHLSAIDGKLLLGQWYNKKLLVLRDDGTIERAYDTPHQVCGVAVVDGAAFVLGTDEEKDGAYYITRVDLATGKAADVADVPFRARGLAWDGTSFWTNHREADRTVNFALPD
ncbi:MAG TPA: hypothetical protein VEJ20_04830 [Candidatus Eremiobacteraceae bacterium]|nr:hypothetical protein [Candidatus Eremiobacteraceae bacterium]